MKYPKSLLRQTLCLVLTLSLMFAYTAIPAYATELDASKEDIAKEAIDLINGEPIDSLNKLKESALNCDFSSMLDTSSFYSAVTSLDNTAFGRLSYDIPTSVNSVALLNLEYVSLMGIMQNAGWGVETTLDIPNLDTGYSENITDRFSNVFGDMSDRMEINATMPEGWTMSEIMAQSSAMRDEMSQSIKKTYIYEAVMLDISTKNLFVSANMTLETPELKSAVQLNSILNESAAELDAEWNQRKTDCITQIQKESADNKAFAEFSSKQDLQDLFDEACGQTDAWLSITEDTILSDETARSKARLMASVFRAIVRGVDDEKDQFLNETMGFDFYRGFGLSGWTDLLETNANDNDE